MSKDVECWCSYLPVPAVTSSHHWLRGVGPATSSITKAASSWRKRHRQAVTREKRTFVQQPRRKHSWKPQGKKHQLQGIPGLFFLGKDEPTWKIQLITNLNPSSTKLTQKIKRNIAATKNHPKSPPKAPGWELPAMAHSPATSASRWSGRGHSWHRWVLLVAAPGSMDCGPNS